MPLGYDKPTVKNQFIRSLLMHEWGEEGLGTQKAKREGHHVLPAFPWATTFGLRDRGRG